MPVQIRISVMTPAELAIAASENKQPSAAKIGRVFAADVGK